jgi:predicted alpha/beta-hydrolase family hydrolase
MALKRLNFKKLFFTIWISLGVLFTAWLFYSSQAQNISPQLLKNDAGIKVVQNDNFYLFTPENNFSKTLIFYPGALVDPEAYVPLCRKIAEDGIKVYLIKMPWRLASKGYKKPLQLRLLSDSTQSYILAGHSQGAKMAAQFVYENPNAIQKLILIGTTHPRDFSLAAIQIPVMKIYGSKDGVADEEAIINNKNKLPATTRFIRLEGANHAQFGFYGFQLGDEKAEISREEQQEETLKHILVFINNS